MFVQEGLNWQLCLFSLHSFSISQFLCFVFSFQIYWKVWASKRFLEKQEYLCVQHFLSSQSEWAGYCQRGIFLPLIPIRHVPSRSKGCLSDTQGHTEEEKAWEKTKISTGQSASPSWDRLPSPSPTTQPSQWWGTSMKYLAAKLRELKTEFVLFLSPQTFPSLCIHRAPVLKAGLAWRGDKIRLSSNHSNTPKQSTHKS